jgi:hypothetical protein
MHLGLKNGPFVHLQRRSASISEGGKYGREIADPILHTACDFHGKCRDLLHAANLRHGADGFTSLPKEGMLRIFCPKNPTASAGFEPANLGTRGQHANH